MTSPALDTWRTSRLPRLDRMLAAHPESVGATSDPALAQEWTDALVLRLAAEFQGYCRDLHDDVVDVLLNNAGPIDKAMRVRLVNGLVLGRGLDRRGADARTIGDDFDRLGSELWDLLKVRRPDVAPAWREGLNQIHRARNGVAHDDRRAIKALEDTGTRVVRALVEEGRKLLDDLATAMDDAIGQDIAELIGKNPWG